MFEIIKSQHVGGLTGFAIVHGNKRFEVSFGPMSASERQNSSKKEFESNPRSGNAEIIVYDTTTGKVVESAANQSVSNFIDMLNWE